MIRRINSSSGSTTISKLNSVDSMKKHSYKLLQFLQTQNYKQNI
jgi:hypothetical protein